MFAFRLSECLNSRSPSNLRRITTQAVRRPQRHHHRHALPLSQSLYNCCDFQLVLGHKASVASIVTSASSFSLHRISAPSTSRNLSSSATPAMSEFYNLKTELPDGKTFDFEQLKGKVVLIVNTASKWYVSMIDSWTDHVPRRGAQFDVTLQWFYPSI